MALLKDEERLKQERAHALQTKERMALEGMGSGSHQAAYGRRASPYGEDYGRTRGSPSSFNCECSRRGGGGSCVRVEVGAVRGLLRPPSAPPPLFGVLVAMLGCGVQLVCGCRC